MLTFVVAALLAQDPSVVDAPVVEAPVVAPVVAPVAAVAAPCVAVDEHAELKRARAVLTAFAEQGRAKRVSSAVGSGALAAGLIGAGITYVAVAHLDGNLSRLNAQDTELAGFVVGAVAIVPAAVFVGDVVIASPSELRLAQFESDTGTDAERIATARESLANEAQASTWPALFGGSSLVVGGLGAGALGAYFLLLPHLPQPRGVVTHGTGAELIGGGVAALGLGIAVLAGSGSDAPTQLQLLE